MSSVWSVYTDPDKLEYHFTFLPLFITLSSELLCIFTQYVNYIHRLFVANDGMLPVGN